jgi:hypothetical protein
MTASDTPVDDAPQLDYGREPEEDWLEEPDELPRRPRRKLLAPVPAALLVALLVAGGFFAGVKVEKGQSASATSSGVPAALAGLRAAGGRSSSRAGSSSGGGSAFPAGAGFLGGGGRAGGLTTGEVSYVSGSTLYVTSGEGNTVKVNAPAGTNVTKTVSTSVHSIHPGDTVIVRGSQGAGGNVTASSISISAAGSGSGAGGSGAGGSTGAGAAQQLFGSG